MRVFPLGQSGRRERIPPLYWNFAFGFGFALCNGIPSAFQDLSLTPSFRELGGACSISAQTAGA